MRRKRKHGSAMLAWMHAWGADDALKEGDARSPRQNGASRKLTPDTDHTAYAQRNPEKKGAHGQEAINLTKERQLSNLLCFEFQISVIKKPLVMAPRKQTPSRSPSSQPKGRRVSSPGEEQMQSAHSSYSKPAAASQTVRNEF